MLIKYENLTIRNATPDDAEQLCAWWNDGEIMAQFEFPNGVGCKPEQIRESLAGGVDDPNRHIIEVDGKPIGEMNYSDKDGAAELGIKICDFSVRDKGYGTKFLTLLIDALFRYYGYEKMILDTDLKNERAQHVYEKKLGFRRLGVQNLKPPEQSDEFYASIVNFEISKAEWFAFQKKPLDYIHKRHIHIEYKIIDDEIEEKIIAWFGDAITKYDMLPNQEGCYRISAMCGEQVVGFAAVSPARWTPPLEKYGDVFIHSIEVEESFRRRGIGRRLITMLEDWARERGYRQIRAWSSYASPEALHMWYEMNYAMCPASEPIYENGDIKGLNPGYYYAKILNPVNPYPNITNLIKQDLQGVSPKLIQNFRLINAKSGVYVYKCLYDGVPAVVKYFEKEDDRREILNYRILAQHDIPTIKTLALGKTAFVMEDISVSEYWRLGIAEDFKDADVTKALAQWYFRFHENGSAVSELDTLYFEFGEITEENLKTLIVRFPEAKELFRFVLTHYGKFRELIFMPSFTLTYNDFHWSNFVVRKDKQAAMMFDYNLLGKGYRFSDFRNVCWDLSEEAKAAFVDEYNRLYFEKHGQTRTEAEKEEERIDDVAAPLFSLLCDFFNKDRIPDWAKKPDGEYLDGSLLSKAKQLLL